MDNKQLVVPYDPNWPNEYNAIAKVLMVALGSYAINIYHVGSTAIPGMIAKPVLDIDIELAPGIEIEKATKLLKELGYEFEGDLGIPDRYAYKNTTPFVPFSKDQRKWMHHHLYICPYNSESMKKMIIFRDKLRINAELRNKYIQIKKKALLKAKGVRQNYIDEKAKIGESFFRDVISAK